MTKRILIMIGFIVIIPSTCSLNKKENEKTIYIHSETKPCTAGVMQKECLQVKWTKNQKEWELFYDDIEGFTYEKGREYVLIIGEEKIENPAADASSVKYKFVKEISKNKVETTTIND